MQDGLAFALTSSMNLTHDDVPATEEVHCSMFPSSQRRDCRLPALRESQLISWPALHIVLHATIANRKSSLQSATKTLMQFADSWITLTPSSWPPLRLHRSWEVRVSCWSPTQTDIALFSQKAMFFAMLEACQSLVTSTNYAKPSGGSMKQTSRSKSSLLVSLTIINEINDVRLSMNSRYSRHHARQSFLPKTKQRRTTQTEICKARSRSMLLLGQRL